MPLEVLHIGAGTRGCHWIEILSQDKRFRSVAVVDPYPRTLESVRTIPGGRSL